MSYACSDKQGNNNKNFAIYDFASMEVQWVGI
jgi:hypothetical protein